MRPARAITNQRRFSAVDEAAFQQRVADALARTALSDVIGRHTALKKAGRELVGLCIYHQERSPSLRVNDAKGRFHCFGCGATGDALKILVDLDRLSFMDALRDLEGGTFPEVDPAERAKRAAEDAAERAAAIAEANSFWGQSRPAAGTLAEVYARSRGIVMPLPPSIRFGVVPLSKDDDGNWREPLPAMLGAVTIGEEIVAIQRIFLKDDGSDKRWRKPKRSKFSLGRVLGGAVWLGPPAEEIVITEGPEDALSLAQEMPGRTVLAALGTAMMPAIQYPPQVRRITVAGQNDDAGAAAVDQAAAALVDRGYTVRTMFPHPDHKDWNDQLLGVCR